MLLTWLSLGAYKADYWTRSSPILVETIVTMLPIIAVDGSIPRIIPEHVWSITDSHCSQDCKGLKQIPNDIMTKTKRLAGLRG